MAGHLSEWMKIIQPGKSIDTVPMVEKGNEAERALHGAMVKARTTGSV